MDAVKGLLLLGIALHLSGCYTLKSAYNQMSLLSSRESYEKVLERTDITKEQQHKLHLAQEARDFAQSKLNLKSDGNYSKVVWLDRPYVSWAVNASDPWLLKPYEWSFPIVGKVPYLGFFSKEEAEEKQNELKKKGLDTYVRGISAYSTLGWFEDPLLSSMLNYDDHVLVETLIHELVHTTVWVKNSVDFNERLASFLGRKGAELFYIQKEGPKSATVKRITDEAYDESLFSDFITKKLADLNEWYKNLKEEDKTLEKKSDRIKSIQLEFAKFIKPRMRTKAWDRFATLELNNARLVLYRTYLQDFSPFEKLWIKVNGDFSLFIQECEKLIKSKNPDKDLEKLVSE